MIDLTAEFTKDRDEPPTPYSAVIGIRLIACASALSWCALLGAAIALL